MPSGRRLGLGTPTFLWMTFLSCFPCLVRPRLWFIFQIESKQHLLLESGFCWARQTHINWALRANGQREKGRVWYKMWADGFSVFMMCCGSWSPNQREMNLPFSFWQAFSRYRLWVSGHPWMLWGRTPTRELEGNTYKAVLDPYSANHALIPKNNH